MKKTIFYLPALFILIMAVSCQSGKENNQENIVISKTIEYDVDINNYKFAQSNPIELGGLWSRENIESSIRYAFLDLLFEKALSGKLKITDLKDKELDSLGIKNTLFFHDTTHLIRPYPPYDEFDTILWTPVNFHHVTALRFREEWSYNTATMALSKKVIAYAPILTPVVFDETYRETYGTPQALFWVICDPDTHGGEILTKRIVYNFSFGEDKRDTHSVDTAGLRDYVNHFLDLTLKDSIQAFIYAKGDLYDKPASGAEILKEFFSPDTIRIMSLDNPELNHDTIVTQDISRISVLRFMEEWSFDPATMSLFKKVVGICPVEEDFDVITGDFRGYRPYYWAYFSAVWQPLKGYVKMK